MSLGNRYDGDGYIQEGKLLGTNRSISSLRDAVASGRVTVVERILTSAERLDTIAQRTYGDGRLWWVIATASGIGWWLQCPAGTRLLIPTDLGQVQGFV